MKRILLVVLGVTLALTAVGLMVSFSRPIRWPANVGPLDWRNALGDRPGQPTEEEAGA